MYCVASRVDPGKFVSRAILEGGGGVLFSGQEGVSCHHYALHCHFTDDCLTTTQSTQSTTLRKTAQKRKAVADRDIPIHMTRHSVEGGCGGRMRG